MKLVERKVTVRVGKPGNFTEDVCEEACELIGQRFDEFQVRLAHELRTRFNEESISVDMAD